MRLSNDELLILDQFIEDQSAMTLYEFWGFVAGVVSHPELVQPSEWLPLLLRRDRPFETQKEAEQILGLIMRFWNQTVQDLDAGRPILPVSEADGLLEWCRGYLDGMFIREEWLDAYEPEKAPTVPFEVYVMFREREAEGSKPLTDDEQELLRSMDSEFLVAEVVHVYQTLKKARQRKAREQNKWVMAGRNDPCPCGSGTKYKRCCLNQRPQ